jgi:CubicO group peptidase (beta-lactamase class C family)
VAKERRVCAASFAVLRAGKLDRASVVSGCTQTLEPTVDSVFQAASLTKPVVAYLALRLALSGALDLNASVAHYLPRGYTHFRSLLARGPNDPSYLLASPVLETIPVYTLLNHSAGFPNWSSGPMVPSFAAATRWQYSGEGYMLLQAILEAVTGRDFSNLIDTQVFIPLGMTRSSLVWKPEFQATVQVGQMGSTSTNAARFAYPAAAASLYTTAQDYARFLGGLMANRPVLELTVGRSIGVDPALQLSWGLGWGIEQTTRGRLLWQWGNNPGYRSFAMFSADSGDGFVLLTSSENGMALAVPLAYEVFPVEHNAFRFRMLS